MTLKERLYSKQWWLDVAEVMDAYRIFPRCLLTSYGWGCIKLAEWFMVLDKPTTEQAGFVGVVIGLAVPLTGWYMQTGRRWTQ